MSATDTYLKTQVESIIPKISVDLLESEIANLPPSSLLVERGDFKVYLAEYKSIPNIINEIGRLRELTFRHVGEGTGNALDIDDFDKVYKNMFFWDSKEKKIVGGYRMGFGKEIIDQFGIGHLYIRSLFDIDNRAHPILEKSIELGRSFIRPEYQKAYLPFFLLWRGILEVLTRNPYYQYLIGPVSISKYYSDVSKSLIVEFVKRHFYDIELAKFFTPKTPYKPNLDGVQLDEMLDSVEGSKLKNLETFLNTISPEHIKVPILLKHYTKLNAKFISFNIDPNFSFALDGLMLLNLSNLPQDIIDLLNDK